MISGEAFRELRKNKGLTLKDVAKHLDVSEQTINKYELEIVRNIPLDKIEKLAKLYDVSPAFIMEWDTQPPTYKTAAGEGTLNDGYHTETVSLRLEDDQSTAIVHGRSMEPTLMDGDIVVISPQSVLDYPRQIALIRIDGEASTLKRVEIKKDGLLLVGDNITEYPPHFYSAQEVQDLPVTIEGVVVKLIREIR